MGATRTSLIVFARRPRAGAVKRRLARVIGRPRAARIYAALLERTLHLAGLAGYDRLILLAAHAGDRAWFRAHHRTCGWLIKPQVRGDLGRRMHRALAAEIAQGRQAVLIGSDIADCSLLDLKCARQALCVGAEAVLGPTVDGGYWLIGLTKPWPQLFDNMPWGGADVCAQTMVRMRAGTCDFVSLPMRRDIDRARDLCGLRFSRRVDARGRSPRRRVPTYAPHCDRVR